MPSCQSISRAKLVGYLDDYLEISSIPDRSVNGLQVEGKSRIVRAAFAVDACLETIRASARRRMDILIVHHGILWGRNERITGVMKNRVAALIENKMSLYAAHLPLDCHEEVGNNAQMARLLGFELGVRFADYHGVQIGYLAETRRTLTRAELVRRIEKTLKTRVEVLTFGPPKIKRIGIVSGEAAGFAAEARDLGCDAFLTGETSHTAYHLAKEARINVIYGGHYATETLGIKALADHLRREFSLECRFIPAPTGY
ncbi:MAG: Nif3-like dinuclear metal center hexameric protein [Candidatus Latescibacterota bacterium]|nr:MAG: Nif3-like dinuclear metal center hexameric protein [Candidatus Latescibacterota bacterium]